MLATRIFPGSAVAGPVTEFATVVSAGTATFAHMTDKPMLAMIPTTGGFGLAILAVMLTRMAYAWKCENTRSAAVGYERLEDGPTALGRVAVRVSDGSSIVMGLGSGLTANGGTGGAPSTDSEKRSPFENQGEAAP